MSQVGPVYLPVSFEKIGFLAVGFSRNDIHGRICSHSAIIYREKEDMPHKTVELTSNGAVLKRTIKAERFAFSWSIPKMHWRVLKAIAIFCEATQGRDFGYWFEYTKDDLLYDDGTTVKLSETSHGLTCSTFVLAVFASQSKPLLDLKSWEAAPEDRKSEDAEHQSWLMQYLADNVSGFSTSKAYLERAEKIPCIRYSPEDVIGACRHGKRPAAFNDAWLPGREVRFWTDEANRIRRPRVTAVSPAAQPTPPPAP